MFTITFHTKEKQINKFEAVEEFHPHAWQINIVFGGGSLLNLLNDVIAGQNNPIYKLLPTSVI